MPVVEIGADVGEDTVEMIIVSAEAGKTLAAWSVENLAVEAKKRRKELGVLGASDSLVERPAGTMIEGIDLMLGVGEDFTPAEILVVREGEDIVAVGPAEMPTGGAGKVLASGAAGLVCKKTDVGERVIYEGG